MFWRLPRHPAFGPLERAAETGSNPEQSRFFTGTRAAVWASGAKQALADMQIGSDTTLPERQLKEACGRISFTSNGWGR
jgi:hypothetical protein